MMLPAQFGQLPSHRETQIAIVILFGRTNKQAARELKLSPRTVERYRANLFVKFGAHSGSDLTRTLMNQPAEAAE